MKWEKRRVDHATIRAYSADMPAKPLSQWSFRKRVLYAIASVAYGVGIVIVDNHFNKDWGLASFMFIVLFICLGLLFVFRPQWWDEWGQKCVEASDRLRYRIWGKYKL